jgi:anthranilate synthase/aminodeoxychorismate synthase-like glutamine amidotransferase
LILLIDNFDSFTYNLFQLLSEMNRVVEVRRNDEVTVSDVEEMAPRGIVISPGPGGPSDAGVSCNLIKSLGGRIPVLGVCLGHQCVGAAFGGKVVRASELRHGKTSLVYHSGEGLFRGLPSPLEAVRYHSLALDRRSIPSCLKITAQTTDGTIMGLRHLTDPIEGVQFHPESVLTKEGPALISNFLAACDEDL